MARYAEENGGLVSIMSAGLDMFWVRDLPGPLQFFMVVQLRVPHAEAGREQVIRFETRRPDLSIVGRVPELRLEAEAGAQHPPGWEIGLPLILPTTLEVEQAGSHSMKVVIEGNERGNWDLPFIVATLPERGYGP